MTSRRFPRSQEIPFFFRPGVAVNAIASFMCRLLFALAFILTSLSLHAETKEELLAAAKSWRESIPFNPGLQPNPQEPVLIAVAHGGRILVSRDDGQSWKEVLFAGPGNDHHPFACKTIAYDGGVFVTALGWGAPGTFLVSTDGENWTHFSTGESTPADASDPTEMPSVYGIAGGKGVFVMGSSSQFTATQDQGKTWTTFHKRSFPDFDSRPHLGTHHVNPLYLGDESGRFIALGDDRSKETGYFGHLFVTDDGGVTWRWLNPEKLYREVEKKGRGKAMIASNGEALLLVQNDASKAWRSMDGGESWEGPFETGMSGSATLNVVGGAFWLVGKESRRSRDGEEWEAIPYELPQGDLVETDQGTLISYDRRRLGLLRSDDGGKSWEEVYSYEDPGIGGGAQGIRDVAFGLAAPLDR